MVTISRERFNALVDTELYMQALENTGALDVLEPMLDVVNEEYKQLKLDWENEHKWLQNTSTINTVENS